MKRGMNLSTRGILLVSFPLLCQLVLMLILSTLVLTLQSETLKEVESHNVVSAIAGETISTIENMTVIDTQSISNEDLAATKTQGERFLQKLAVLRKRTDSQVVIEQIDRVHDLVVRVGQEIYWATQQRELGMAEWIAASKKIREDLATLFPRLVDETMEIPALDEQVRRKSPARSKDVRNQISFALLAAVQISIVSALWLGYLYGTGISRPLRRIAYNSTLLSGGLPLLPALQGTDELSKLDQMLHTVSNEITTAVAREKSLISNAAELICSLDAEGQFTAANAFSETMLGISRGALLGKHIGDVTTPRDSLLAEEHLRASRSSEQGRVFELQLLRADAAVIETSWSCFWSPMQNSVFCVVHDITEEKRASRLKETFSDMISGDLRSPLIMALNEISAARDLSGKDSRAAQTMNELESNLKKLLGFLNDWLDFQKLEPGRLDLALAEHGLSDVIGDAVDLIRTFSQSKKIEVVQPSVSLTMVCDRKKIVQVLVNLLSNAIKFSAPDSQVVLSVNEMSDFIEISVADKGTGVPAAFREKIFAPFEQVAATAKGGTGLGLSICKMVVESHGGTIGVRSRHKDDAIETTDGSIAVETETGSTFWFHLPKLKLPS